MNGPLFYFQVLGWAFFLHITTLFITIMINKITLVGRVGEDPKYKILEPSGTEVIEFSFATSEKYKDKEDVQWHQIKAYGPVAQILQKHGFKGQLLYLEGKVAYRKYQDVASIWRNVTEIICSTVKIFEWKDD